MYILWFLGLIVYQPSWVTYVKCKQSHPGFELWIPVSFFYDDIHYTPPSASYAYIHIYLYPLDPQKSTGKESQSNIAVH